MDNSSTLSGRKLKFKLIDVLQYQSTENIKNFIIEYNSRLISPLFTATYNNEPKVFWNAVSSFGILANYLNIHDKEKLREIIRKCIWMLTEESGGIAWMAPAIIGEILANSQDMADEFSNVLFSYVYEAENEPENFLDHPPHRNSALWGIQRLLDSYPSKINNNEYIIKQRLELENEPAIIANILLIIRNSKLKDTQKFLAGLHDNHNEVLIYNNFKLSQIKICDLAREVSEILEN